MNIYESLAMADISDITRPKSSGRMVDTRVVHAPAEPRPDYDKMRRMVHGDAADLKVPAQHDQGRD
ncbi:MULTISPECIES: hypothetical protein [unclassified Rhizobium]|uniref:hypothetical protein n=1 Tax=unclassified Rhizobium TaxID=2613769 RepID=UPI001ADCA4D0|nr:MULTISPECIES: hypothetical protein [unclassified Rhizobium]MBO9100320.1 hypothetical protein [Rhizobium sp. L58/93]MBO9186213.1 hypothetical protein [Rhizobium sp. E27B/91]QXZ83132.1 hypothetical protein J5287_13765 [Rhizobium sp. K1/93]QXZ89356.1 hypothetical protein J5280_14825 [Rhizobium sp. K15/93]QYA01944.1 hypothetical protein J5278_01765 [Rhizobium sp. B21/90]